MWLPIGWAKGPSLPPPSSLIQPMWISRPAYRRWPWEKVTDNHVSISLAYSKIFQSVTAEQCKCFFIFSFKSGGGLHGCIYKLFIFCPALTFPGTCTIPSVFKLTRENQYSFKFLSLEGSYLDPSLWWGESLTISLKTAQNFLKTKFPTGQLKIMQKKSHWQMNRVIDGFPYM